MRRFGARSFYGTNAIVASVRVVALVSAFLLAGIGSVLLALAHGKRPIVMARRQALGENVDDHQVAFARRLHEAGLVQAVENAEELARAVSERTSHSFEALEENERLPDELHERLSRACAA